MSLSVCQSLRPSTSHLWALADLDTEVDLGHFTQSQKMKTSSTAPRSCWPAVAPRFYLSLLAVKAHTDFVWLIPTSFAFPVQCVCVCVRVGGLVPWDCQTFSLRNKCSLTRMESDCAGIRRLRNRDHPPACFNTNVFIDFFSKLDDLIENPPLSLHVWALSTRQSASRRFSTRRSAGADGVMSCCLTK